MENNEVIWENVKGYEGYYMVANNGVVKGIDRAIIDKRVGFRNIKGVVLKYRQDDYGYVVCELSKDRKPKTAFIHRLLAEIFIPNPHNKRDVNHKNGIRNDNRLENLEWATRSENCIHGYRSNGRISAVKRKVRCISTGKEFSSITEAALFIGADKRNVQVVCAGKQKTVKGLIFEYI